MRQLLGRKGRGEEATKLCGLYGEGLGTACLQAICVDSESIPDR